MSRKQNKYSSNIVLIYMFTIIFILKIALENLWILLIPLIVIALYFFVKYKQEVIMARRFHSIDSLLEEYKSNPYEFEHYIADLYHLMGYKTVVTSKTNDRGKDIIMWKNGLKYVVEVKLYAKERNIDRPKIQKFHSAMIDSDADGAIFVTTGGFNKNAKLYAEKFHIQIIDGYELIKLIEKVNQKYID